MRLHRAADAALIERSRGGDSEAFGELWRRHHEAGVRAARSMAPSLDSDDLVSEAFANILVQLDRGKGPSSNFRAYLYQAIRNNAADAFRDADREAAGTDLDAIPDPVLDPTDPAIQFNLIATRRAFDSLPERLQEVLWYTEVEQLPPRKAAPILGISAAAVATLAMRARNRLRAAWIAEHAKDPELSPECRAAIGQLPRYLKGQLEADERETVDAHLAGCPICSQLLQDAERIYVRPGGAIAASVLGLGTAATLKFSAGIAAPAVAAALAGSFGAKILTGALAAVTATALIVTIVASGGGGTGGSAPSPANASPSSSGSTARGLDDRRSGGDAEAEQGDAEPPYSGDGSRGVPSPQPGAVPEQPRVPASGGGPAATPAPSSPTPSPPAPTTPEPSTPAPPAEPVGPSLPSIADALPKTLPPLAFSVERAGARLWLRGVSAVPESTVRLRVTSQPLPGGTTYGVVLQTRAWSNGYWAFGNLHGLAPLNVTVEAQQLTTAAASPWATAVENETLEVALASRTPGDYNGVQSWYVHGWPGAHWALREVGAAWPRSSGRFSSGGGAIVPVPADVPAGTTRE